MVVKIKSWGGQVTAPTDGKRFSLNPHGNLGAEGKGRLGKGP